MSGVLLGHLRESASVALGDYPTLFGDASGQPYGDRVRRLIVSTTTVTLGGGLGALVQPGPRPVAVVVVGLVAAAGVYWPALGIPAVLSVTLAYFALPGVSVPPHMGTTAAGGLLAVLLVVAVWPVRASPAAPQGRGGGRYGGPDRDGGALGGAAGRRERRDGPPPAEVRTAPQAGGVGRPSPGTVSGRRR